jgi:hypothetical protein
MADLVTIATFAVPWEAHIMRGALEVEGIPAFIIDEHARNSFDMPCVRLQVRPQDAKRALEIKRDGAPTL